MKSSQEIKNIAQNCVLMEYDAVKLIYSRIDENFVEVVRVLFKTKGRVIVSAIGKSANIANKLVATFNSTGQPSIFLHATEAIHGDLGNIQAEDVVIVISKSGNTSEIISLIPLIKNMNNIIIAMTGNTASLLAKSADFVLDVTVDQEACPNNLAPTSSTTAQLVMGDALAVSLLACKDFSDKDFAKYHPGGILGKRLTLRIKDLLDENCLPAVNLDASIDKVIFEISSKRLGATAVLSEKKIEGIITDGDLRRMLEPQTSFTHLLAKDIMSPNPRKMNADALAYDALRLMKNNNISQLIIVDQGDYAGMIHMHEIIKQGIV